ncbi:putative Eukaryotic aspartyl protease family protein [Tripterygium wilfordii]|uniref:Putative Eukaryotic aspartyl protease family protein n=1 Tax=Tripterygium wilfordii TaxID=458696 RepID=A0A7J7DSC2_TRIWF|nr:aspartic proteinase CDR1-like [Tripterygium wilfordii]KAF5749268.1 putative Eukaryotic aspartyl protease family protein [Tripterygium wilfordii]
MALFVNNSHSLFSFAFVFTLSSLCLFTEAYNGGFTVDLIHRDSPKSPFYNSSETPSQRLTKSLRRSFHRAKQFNPASSSYSPNAAESEIIADNGEYLMKLGLGTPSVEVLAIADTGSDLIWTQCKPCSQCFNQSSPIFDPKSSKTYKDISCSSDQCQSLPDTSCSDDGSSCQYNVRYGDSSNSNGNLAVETITLGSSTDGRPVALPNSTFGCGHNNELIYQGNTSGIVGLGGGAVSLVSQIGSGKFSYCLLPISNSDSNSTSKLKFGNNAVVSGPGTVSTPLVSGGGGMDTFYFLKLEAISVADERIDFNGSSGGDGEGNIIIDSGTTLTLLPQDFYSSFESAVSSKIDAKQTNDPSGTLNLCYEAESGSDFNVPDITVHFTDADVKLSSLNTFVMVAEGVVCLAFHSSDSLSIFGNLAQMNFLVGYDVEEHSLSFKPTDCSKA